jgi:hypothetical protein
MSSDQFRSNRGKKERRRKMKKTRGFIFKRTELGEDDGGGL